MEISVVIPVYNVENYLKKCLDSVVNQKFYDFEVVIVNDGSTDNSYKIINEYEEKYNNLKVINTPNKGLSAARNTGLDNSSGKYIVFVDSDDYISEDYLKDLYNCIVKDDSDIAICSFERVTEENNLRENINLDSNKVYSNLEILKEILRGKLQCYAWNKMYKKSLFLNNNLRYPPGMLYEDIAIFVELVISSKSMVFINKPLYKYRIREGSITNVRGKKAAEHFNYAIDRVNNIVMKNNLFEKVSKELVNFNLMYSLSVMDIIGIYTDYNIKEFYSEYNRIFNNKYFSYNSIKVLLNSSVLNWVKRDFLLFKLGLLAMKNKIRDKR